MATIIKIKNSGLSGAPSTLATGELAYSYLQQLPVEGIVSTNGGDRLYIGTGTEVAGESTDIVHIGGKYYMDMLDHENGILTANSAIITNSESKINELNVDSLNFNSNIISITETNSDLILQANGTGTIRFESEVDLTLVNVDTLGSSRTDGNIFVQPGGTGYVQVSSQNALRMPVGNTSSRDASPLAGMMRFNSTLGFFEGYDGNAWNTMGGAKVQDIDGNTYISAENTPGANNNQMRIFTDGLERQRVESDGGTLFSTDLTAGTPVGTRIYNNRIETFGSDILYLDPSTGEANTGSVVIEGNLTIKGVTTTVDSASTKSNDPTIILGYQSDENGDEVAMEAPDGLDKGIEFRWYDSSAHSGFFGYDSSAKRFTFIEDATNTNDTFSGTPSDVRFGNALLTDLSFTVFTANSVPWVDVNGDTSFITGDDASVYNGGDTTGQVLQMNASGLPIFSHIDCGTY